MPLLHSQWLAEQVTSVKEDVVQLREAVKIELAEVRDLATQVKLPMDLPPELKQFWISRFNKYVLPLAGEFLHAQYGSVQSPNGHIFNLDVLLPVLPDQIWLAEHSCRVAQVHQSSTYVRMHACLVTCDLTCTRTQRKCVMVGLLQAIVC